MTKFQLISELTSIINALLLSDVTGCNINDIRGLLKCLFDEFEEHEGTVPRTKNTSRDLELYFYVIDSLYERGYKLWLEDIEDNDESTSVKVDGDDAFPQESEQCCICRKLDSIINALGEHELQKLFR